MAGPLSSNEIEDVVSSVRRLVSVDTRPRPQTRDLAQDRLVLTPALRIVPVSDDDSSPLLLTVPLVDDQPTAAIASDTDADSPALQAVEAEWEEEIWSEPDPPLAELALGTEEAELVEEMPPSAPHVLFSESGFDSLPEDEAPWIEVEDELEDAADFAQCPLRPTETPPEPVATQATFDRADVLKLSREDMLTDGDGNPLTVLDEAALQQIIRQLIREELKGVLGERITQSVRKLVRAEINRALAAHALD